MTDDPRIVQLRRLRAKAYLGGGQERIEAQHKKGKFTARERLDILLDAGSFQEIEPLILNRTDEFGMNAEQIPGDGVVTGFGTIESRTVFVYAQDFTVHGGTLSDVQSHKICRVMDLAVRKGAPIIGLIDSGGARIQEGVKSLAGYAEIFRRNARYSGLVPQISVMLGPCAGGAAYSPALTDLILMVENQSFMFLTGPEVIKAVTGEIVDPESLGGSEIHMNLTGTAHVSAPTEMETLHLTRRLLTYLPANNTEQPPKIVSQDDPQRLIEELNSLIPLDPAEPYSMHSVVAAIIDQGTFLELQPDWARNAIIGLARMDGAAVGIVAQEPCEIAGVIDIDAADKIARFVRMCDCYNLPLVTLVDSPGFLPGIDQEYRGIIRHGAKVLYAYAEASVPKVTIITRKAYGGAYIVMSSKYLGTDITYAWPSAELAVMGAEAAVNVIYRKKINAATDPSDERARLVEDYRQKFNNPYYAAQSGYVDDIIEPGETRRKIISALAGLGDRSIQHLPRKHGNMPV